MLNYTENNYICLVGSFYCAHCSVRYGIWMWWCAPGFGIHHPAWSASA